VRNENLDDLNKKLLKSLEEDSRRSLKELAAELNIKTSTIYHRLHRLKESKILEGFSIIVNPDEMNLSIFNFLTVSLVQTVKSLDRIFIESFAQYLAKEFEEILFVSISRTKVYLISCHTTPESSEEFLEKIKSIPYVDNVDLIQFDKIIKGHKLFTFNEAFFNEGKSIVEPFELKLEKSLPPGKFDITDTVEENEEDEENEDDEE